jgi:hypothetical protein
MTKYQSSTLTNSIIIAVSIAIAVPAHANGRSNSGGAPMRPIAAMSGVTTAQFLNTKRCVQNFTRRIIGHHQVFDVTYNCKGEVISYISKLKDQPLR